MYLYIASPSVANDVKKRTRLAAEVPSYVLGDECVFAAVLAGVDGFDGLAGLAGFTCGFTIVFGEVTLTLVVTDMVFPSASV